jgi:hypothetical protein
MTAPTEMPAAERKTTAQLLFVTWRTKPVSMTPKIPGKVDVVLEILNINLRGREGREKRGPCL